MSWEDVRASVMRRAAGRCECIGQCGQNHRWEPGLEAQQCRAPHGCNVRRKKDHPSYWVLAARQGFEDREQEGPRVADPDGLIRRGIDTAELAFAELYRPRLVQIWLEPARVGTGAFALCQRCLQLSRQGGTDAATE